MPENDPSPLLPTGSGLESILPRLDLSAYLAALLVRADEHVAAREGALLIGDDVTARVHDEALARDLCVGLGRVADNTELPTITGQDQQIANFIWSPGHPQIADFNLEFDEFYKNELILLRLAGLGTALAQRYLDAALSAGASGPRITTPEKMRDAIDLAAERACAAYTAIAEQRRAATSRRWRRVTLHRCLIATGGVLLVVVNTVATPLITPIGALASATIGAGAAGSAANLIEI